MLDNTPVVEMAKAYFAEKGWSGDVYAFAFGYLWGYLSEYQQQEVLDRIENSDN